MAVLAKQPGPVVGAGTGFHADEAWWQVGDEGQELVALHFGLDQFGLAAFVDPVNYKNMLGEIDHLW